VLLNDGKVVATGGLDLLKDADTDLL